MGDLVFRAIDADTPGFLEILISVPDLQKVKDAKSAEQLAQFLLRFVEKPQNREEAYRLILRMSVNELVAALGALMGGEQSEPNPTQAKTT